jgi:hypothetical protein
MESTATAISVPFIGLWLDAPAAALIARVHQRSGDASDADEHVVREQLTHDLGPIAWQHVDASQPEEAVVAEAERCFGLDSPGRDYETTGPNARPITSATSAASSQPAAQTPTARAV